MIINCKVKGLDKLEKKLKTIIRDLPKTIENSVEDIIKNIRGYSIRLEKGHNQDGILVELIENSTMQVKGRVYTSKENMPWAAFEHFGTGDYRELSAIGKTQHFIATGGSQWFIPVAKVPKELGYPKIEIQGIEFYVAHGVKANHFLTDAEFESRNENIEIVKKKLDEMIKRCCK